MQVKKENVFFTDFFCSWLPFLEYLCLTICLSWTSSRTNVLLSRKTNLKGLYSLCNYTWNAIKKNMDALQEYDHLRKNFPFIPDLGLTCKSTDLSITWLNIRYLWKHTTGISGDAHFHTDILVFSYGNISCLVKIFLTYS